MLWIWHYLEEKISLQLIDSITRWTKAYWMWTHTYIEHHTRKNIWYLNNSCMFRNNMKIIWLFYRYRSYFMKACIFFEWVTWSVALVSKVQESLICLPFSIFPEKKLTSEVVHLINKYNFWFLNNLQDLLHLFLCELNIVLTRDIGFLDHYFHSC